MATPIRLKRSAVTGKRPQVSDLQLGELALNFYDGYLWAKRDTAGVGIGTTIALLTPWAENFGAGSIYYDNLVGVGTQNVGAKFHVVPTSSNIAGLFSGTTSSDMVRITQTGSGNAFVVEDETNPDITKFVINSSGDVAIGSTDSAQKLYVDGNVLITGSSTFVGTIFGDSAAFIKDLRLALDDSITINSVSGDLRLGSSTGQNVVNVLNGFYVTGISTFNSLVRVGSGVSLTPSGIITASTRLSTGVPGEGINITTNTISGPSIIFIDPAGIGDNTGAVRIKGDLYVDGTQTIVNSNIVDIVDIEIGIATAANTDVLLDGAGFALGTIAVRKSFNWNYPTLSLKSSENLDLAINKVYKINGTEVLSATTLTVPNLNVSGIGTIGTLNNTTANIGTANITTGNIVTGIVTTLFTSGTATIATGNIVTGVVTTLSGSNATYTTGNFGTANATTGNIVTGVVTTISGTSAFYNTGTLQTGNIVTGIVTTLFTSGTATIVTGNIVTGIVTTLFTSGTATINTANVTTGVVTTLSGSNATYTTGNFGTANATTGNIVTGVVTTLSGSNATYTTGNFTTANATTGNIVTGVVTTLSGSNATYTTGNFTTANATTGNIVVILEPLILPLETLLLV